MRPIRFVISCEVDEQLKGLEDDLGLMKDIEELGGILTRITSSIQSKNLAELAEKKRIIHLRIMKKISQLDRVRSGELSIEDIKKEENIQAMKDTAIGIGKKVDDWGKKTSDHLSEMFDDIFGP